MLSSSRPLTGFHATQRPVGYRRDIQRAGAGIWSLAEPFLDTASNFADIIFAILGVAAKLERRRILERTARGQADA